MTVTLQSERIVHIWAHKYDYRCKSSVEISYSLMPRDVLLASRYCTEHVLGEVIAILTPEYVPGEFSSPKGYLQEEETQNPIQPHANIELVTFDILTLIQERDRLEFRKMRQRHPLLHQIDRTQWQVLSVIVQLHSLTLLGSLLIVRNLRTRDRKRRRSFMTTI